MTAVLGGLAAAVAWAATMVLVAKGARQMPLLTFAYGFVLYQAILLAVPALIWLVGSSVDAGRPARRRARPGDFRPSAC